MLNKNTFLIVAQLRQLFAVLLATLLVALSACNDEPENLGLSVQPEDELLNPIMVDTFTVVASTVMWDSMRTSLTGRVLSGRYVDAALGAFQAEGYFELRALRSDISFSDTAVFEQLELQMQIEYLYGALDQAQTFYLYPLLDSLTPTRQFFTTEKARYETEPLATASIVPSETPDKLVFRLDKLGQQIFELGGSDQIASLDNFLQTFKGLALVPHPSNTAMLGFGMSGDVVTVAQMTWQTGPAGGRDSIFLTGQGIHFTGFSKNFEFTALDGLDKTGDIISPDQANGAVYLQASSGIRVKLELPTLDAFLAQNPDILIHRAELQIKPQARTTDVPPPNNITLAESDQTNRLLTFTNGDQRLIFNSNSVGSSNSALVFPFDQSQGIYNCNITNHLIFLQNKELNNTGIIVSALSGALTVNSAIIPFSNNDKGIKLRLIYSKLNQ